MLHLKAVLLSPFQYCIHRNHPDADSQPFSHPKKIRGKKCPFLLPASQYSLPVSYTHLLVGTYQIVTRYFFNRPSTISEELLTYSFTWMSLLASAYVFGKRDHMRMGFMADKLTGPDRRYLEVFIDALSFFFAGVVMVYGGISITKLTMIQITASLRISMGWIYIIVPIAGLLIMVFSVMNAADMLHKDFSEPGEAKV